MQIEFDPEQVASFSENAQLELHRCVSSYAGLLLKKAKENEKIFTKADGNKNNLVQAIHVKMANDVFLLPIQKKPKFGKLVLVLELILTVSSFFAGVFWPSAGTNGFGWEVLISLIVFFVALSARLILIFVSKD